jgi:hypothetical protein
MAPARRAGRGAALWASLAALVVLPACGVCLSSPAQWKQGDPPRQLAPTGLSVCVLTRVSGHFEGGGERVRVYWKDGSWWLAGTSQQSGVAATAYCMRRSCFKGEKGGTTFVSSEFEVKTLNPPTFPGLSGCDCGGNYADTWPAGAATFITGIGGQFEGGAEHVWVEQSAGGTSRVRSHSCQCGELRGWAHGFSVGPAGAGQAARFVGPNGTGSADVAGDYVRHSKGTGAKDVEMAPTSVALCYFTEIGGDFRGGGEFVEIRPGKNAQGVEVWYLTAASQSGSGVFARARCLSRVQPGAPD